MNQKEFETICVQMTKGLSYLHDKSIFHRDLKPDNMLLLNDGQIVICDFGHSRIVQRMSQTQKSMAGTFLYLSPEGYKLWDSETPENYVSEIKGSSDVWSLAATMYFCATQKLLFES
jgi:serine/threonine-protein kinase Chk2